MFKIYVYYFINYILICVLKFYYLIFKDFVLIRKVFKYFRFIIYCYLYMYMYFSIWNIVLVYWKIMFIFLIIFWFYLFKYYI